MRVPVCVCVYVCVCALVRVCLLNVCSFQIVRWGVSDCPSPVRAEVKELEWILTIFRAAGIIALWRRDGWIVLHATRLE